jgi:hypothetical protein
MSACAPLEVGHRVAALHHQLAHQAIGLDQRAARVVDEAALQLQPLACIARAFVGRQRHEVQLLHAALARQQLGLGLLAAAQVIDGAGVLRAEAPLQAASIRCGGAAQRRRAPAPRARRAPPAW